MHLYATHLDALHIVILSRKEHGFSGERHEENLHLYPTNSRSRVGMLFDAYRIGKNIRANMRGTENCVVSAQDPFALGLISYLLCLVTHAQFHVQVHGDYFSPHWGTNPMLRGFWRIVARFLFTRAIRIRVVSERIKNSLINKGIHKSRITVLPIRPELESFLKSPRFERGGNVLTFLAMSRFSSEKNIPLIVDAFSVLHNEYPNIRLRLVGDGPEKAYVEKYIQNGGAAEAVTILPWTEDAVGEMQKADIFLLASRHEAYGLTLVEAMASGLPIITTDVGCVGELVKNGVHGIVTRVNDRNAYVLAMKRMVTHEDFRSACGRAGRETAEIVARTSAHEYAKAWVASLS